MSTQSQAIVDKLWRYCDLLRDDGLSYGDYVEQLTYLLFLKMAHERTEPPYNQPATIPAKFDWGRLRSLSGIELEGHYNATLAALGKGTSMLGTIFRKAQNKIQSPANLRKLIVELIDRETWTSLSTDVKGDAYEGLLQKNAEDTKSGAGQYFTPRSLIQAIVDVMQLQVGETVCDPACGTGGFFLGAYDYMRHTFPQMDRDELRALQRDTFSGWEIVDNTARLCLMNLYLHGIVNDEQLPISVQDSLLQKPTTYFDVVLSNPPFGRKTSASYVSTDSENKQTEANAPNRDDFWATTSNKQLNFVQHIYSLLKTTGRAAVVLPDNVLFEGGAGEKIRRELLMRGDVHTLLRLPTGIFYAQGVKANVLFFDKRPANVSNIATTQRLWVYDLRTNQNFTLRTHPLLRHHLADFVAAYQAKNRNLRVESERFRSFSYDDLSKRDKLSLDLFWLRDASLEDADSLPSPSVLAASIVEDIEAALEQFRAIDEGLDPSVDG